jgi:GGDEF domain-containing protein
VGAAEFPVDGGDAETLIACADNALYIAKGRGRNQVIFSEDARSSEN